MLLEKVLKSKKNILNYLKMSDVEIGKLASINLV